jgi:chemotaxis protein MotA
MDLATILGIVLAIGSILGGQALEGGHMGSIMQGTAFLIVMGGTFGACIMQYPLPVVIEAQKMLMMVFFDKKSDLKGTITQIVELSNISRKQGLLALEGKIKDIPDPFFAKGVQLVVDGMEAKVIMGILEVEVDHEEESANTAAKFWEAAGGYAPTVGILGAVMGLIHVMENLSDPSKLGGGIAVAFVATIYGVGAANLFFLPFATKIKLKIKKEALGKNVIIQGLIGIAQGENPRQLQEKLEGYLPHSERSTEKH